MVCNGQLVRVWNASACGRWRTLGTSLSGGGWEGSTLVSSGVSLLCACFDALAKLGDRLPFSVHIALFGSLDCCGVE